MEIEKRSSKRTPFSIPVGRAVDFAKNWIDTNTNTTLETTQKKGDIKTYFILDDKYITTNIFQNFTLIKWEIWKSSKLPKVVERLRMENPIEENKCKLPFPSLIIVLIKILLHFYHERLKFLVSAILKFQLLISYIDTITLC